MIGVTEKLIELWREMESWDALQDLKGRLNDPLSRKEALTLKSRIGFDVPMEL